MSHNEPEDFDGAGDGDDSAEQVPSNVLVGIEDIHTGRTATTEELIEASQNDSE